MAEPGGRGWVPFPVQDASRLPYDPLAEPLTGDVRGTAWVEHDLSTVDPGWGPPAAARRWWVPLVVLVCLGALVAGGAWAGLREPAAPSEATRFVPADGAATYELESTTRELQTVTRPQVTESARLDGTAALLSGDSAFTVRALGADFADPGRARLWRTVTTPLNDPTEARQTVRFYRLGAGAVELAGESGPSEGYVYSPGLVELPEQVGAGDVWAGQGSAGDTFDYRSRFRVDAVRDDCVDVTGELDLLSKAGQLGRRYALTRTWCAGQGVVASSRSIADVRTVVSRTERPEPGRVVTATAGVSWDDPSGWVPTRYGTVSIDPTFGEGPMNGTPQTEIAPVRTDSGLVVRTLAAPTDLVATTPKTLTDWVAVWRAHPGGQVLSATAFGNVVLVVTSERRLVAYADTGARLWDRPTAEVVPTAPVRVSATDVVVVDLAGDVVRLDLASGIALWEASVGADVNRTPAVGAGVVVVADRQGRVSALDAGSGRTRWREELAAKAVAVVGDTVAVVQDQVLHGLAADSGRHRYVRHYGGGFTALAAVGERVALASKTETIEVDATGAVTATLPGSLALSPTGGHLVAWGPDRVDVSDLTGRVAGSWPTTAVDQVSAARPALVAPDGMALYAEPGWTFTSWGVPR